MKRVAMVAVLALGGCFFSFDNPVSAQDAGTLSGQLVLVNPAADQTTARATVTLLWSGGLTATLDETGRFLFLGLTDGIYSLAYRVPPQAPNDALLSGYRPSIVLPEVDGSPNSIDLGQLQLAAGATVTGTISGADGPVVVAAFQPDGGVYEGYAAVVDGGSYAVTVPAGAHDLVASTADRAATVTLTLPAGAQQKADFALVAASGGGRVTGQIVFVGPGLGASVPAPDDLTNGIGTNATQNGNDVSEGLVAMVSADAGTTALAVASSVGAGQALDLTLAPSAAASAQSLGPDGAIEGPYGPLTLPNLPLIAGRDTALGQITWLPLSIFALNSPDGGL
jgi:hypothetical protein